MHGGGCVVATREKKTAFLFMDDNYFLNHVLFLMQLFVAHKQSFHCCNLIIRDLLDSFF